MKTLLILLSLLLFTACARTQPQQPQTELPPVLQEDTPTEPETPAEPEVPAPAFTAYTETIRKSTIEICAGPGYHTGFVAILEPGVYTIVEEATDDSGLLWGKLKSSIGWIDLTYNREITNVIGPITFHDADPNAAATYVFRQSDTLDYASHYKITTAEPVTDLQLRSCDFQDKGPVPDAVIYRLDALNPEEGLSVSLIFPGDLTNYALTFTDGSGTTRSCTFMHSGRDGSLVVQEYLG